MQQDLFAREDSAKWIESSFYPVRVLDRKQEDGKNSPAVEELQKKFSVDSFPTLVVVFPTGGDPQIQKGYPGKMRTRFFLSHALTTSPRTVSEKANRKTPDSSGQQAAPAAPLSSHRGPAPGRRADPTQQPPPPP